MASISEETLKTEIHDILKDADLNVLSAKKVRLQLQEKFMCDLLSRKTEINKIVMDFVNSKEENDQENSEESEEEEQKSPVKRKAPPTKKSAKKKKDDTDGSDNDKLDEEYSPRKSKGRRVKKKGAADGEKKEPKVRAKGKATGFTRAYKLSPELASFMGAEAMPRHEVVKKMWTVIKERNLLDPKNKQFAICDDEIRKIMGVKKFRTFGMLKYLKVHFLE